MLTLWKSGWYLEAEAMADALAVGIDAELAAIDDDAAARVLADRPPSAVPPPFPWEGDDGTDDGTDA